MAVAEKLVTIRFGDYSPDAEDNFDEWAGHSPNHLLRRVGGVPFRTESSFWQLGHIVITEQRIDPFGALRTAARALAVPTDQVTLVVLLDGDLSYHHEDAAQRCSTGDVVLLDFARSYEFVVGRQYSATISVDRGVLEDEVGPLTVHGRMPRTAETRMLTEFVKALVGQLPEMAAASAVPTATILRRLMILALQSDHPPISAPRLQTVRVRALAYIDAHPPGTLDVTEMARSLGLTRATLYRLFKADGGVLAYDRRRRLRLLHRSLCDESSDVTLGELGARYGFFDLSNLSRLFKMQFGISMSEVREHLLPRSMEGGAVGQYREAIARFR